MASRNQEDAFDGNSQPLPKKDENERVHNKVNEGVLGLHVEVEDDQEEEAEDWVEDGEEEEEDRVALGIVGKVWTNRKVNPKAFMDAIKNVWLPKHGLEVSNIGENLFQFQFFHWKDKSRVLNGQPWHFDRFALLLGELQDIDKPDDIQLVHIPMWVRFYGLPFKGRQNEVNARNLGEKVGQYLSVDFSQSMGIEKSLRVRVLVDARKPLKHEVKLNLRGGKEEIFKVRYEKLPLFCFHCGRLGHGTKDCDVFIGDGSPEKKLGGWLEASPWRPISSSRGEGSQDRTSSCAKALFVTKPKQKEVSSSKKHISEV